LFFEMDKEKEPGRIPSIADGDDVPFVLRIVTGEFMLPWQGIDWIKDGSGPGPALVRFGEDQHPAGIAIEDIGVLMIKELAIRRLSLVQYGQRVFGVHRCLTADPGLVVRIQDRPGRGKTIFLIKAEYVQRPAIPPCRLYKNIVLRVGHADLPDGIKTGML